MTSGIVGLISHLCRTHAVVLSVAFWGAMGGSHAVAEVRGPYEADEHTLHLYHFDSPGKTADDAITKSSQFGLNLSGGAIISKRSYPGFGHSLSTLRLATAHAHLAKKVTTKSYWNQESTAFTYEALVLMDFEPNEMLADRVERMNIMALDSDASSQARSFILSLRPVGVLGASAPSLVFVKYAGPQRGAVQTIVAELPLSGVHMPTRGHWFHVAVAYSGEAGVANNLRLYWTRVDPRVTKANLLSTASLEKDPEDQKSSIFSVGNSGRTKDGLKENWVGLIDEVRISDVCREPGDFLFTEATAGGSTAPSPLLQEVDSKVSEGEANEAKDVKRGNQSPPR